MTTLVDHYLDGAIWAHIIALREDNQELFNDTKEGRDSDEFSPDPV